MSSPRSVVLALVRKPTHMNQPSLVSIDHFRLAFDESADPSTLSEASISEPFPCLLWSRAPLSVKPSLAEACGVIDAVILGRALYVNLYHRREISILVEPVAGGFPTPSSPVSTMRRDGQGPSSSSAKLDASA